jgi:hypothetical protein
MSDSSASKGGRNETGYIVNPVYDCLFFLYSPLIALFLGIAITLTPLATEVTSVLGHNHYLSDLFIGSFIAAHLFAVIFRSHGNRVVFRQFRWRFTLAPIVLYGAMWFSTWVFVSITVLAIWWDVYHSGMQTFGLGRIYDRCAGNKDPELGRSLDKWLNILLYVGPILAGASLMSHIEYFDQFHKIQRELDATAFDPHTASFLGNQARGLELVMSQFCVAVPSYAKAHSLILRFFVIGIGTPFLIYYIFSYWRLKKSGYKVSRQKVILYAGTGFCSIYTWGFNSFGQAFFIMNFFHAVQYFALIWWSEERSLRKLFLLERVKAGAPIAFVLFLSICFAYGFWTSYQLSETPKPVWILAMVISIMHFWYDGFIWSVRKKQI